jgi:hypothetical protein
MDIRLSHVRGILDYIMASFQRVAFRCRWCAKRFYRHVPVTEEAESLAAADGFESLVLSSIMAGGATAFGPPAHAAMSSTVLLATAFHVVSPAAIGTPLVSFPLRFQPPITGASPCSQSFPL